MTEHRDRENLTEVNVQDLAEVFQENYALAEEITEAATVTSVQPAYARLLARAGYDADPVTGDPVPRRTPVNQPPASGATTGMDGVDKSIDVRAVVDDACAAVDTTALAATAALTAEADAYSRARRAEADEYVRSAIRRSREIVAEAEAQARQAILDAERVRQEAQDYKDAAVETAGEIISKARQEAAKRPEVDDASPDLPGCLSEETVAASRHVLERWREAWARGDSSRLSLILSTSAGVVARLELNSSPSPLPSPRSTPTPVLTGLLEELLATHRAMLDRFGEVVELPDSALIRARDQVLGVVEIALPLLPGESSVDDCPALPQRVDLRDLSDRSRTGLTAADRL
jgi:hypothetical protein